MEVPIQNCICKPFRIRKPLWNVFITSLGVAAKPLVKYKTQLKELITLFEDTPLKNQQQQKNGVDGTMLQP